MQQCITQPAFKNRGKSVPVTKGCQEKVKKSKQQPKSKLHQLDDTQLKSPQKYGKRKNRGYSTQPNEEMNALILSLWERHYIEHPGEYKKTGGIKLWTTGQQENPTQNSSSNKSRSFKPTPEELNIIEQELNLFYGPFYSEFIEDAFQFEALYYQLAKRNFFRTPTTSSPLVLCYYFFSLFFSFYKPENLDIIRRICPYTQIFLEKIEKADKQVRRGLLQLFRSINISHNPGLPLQFQEYLLYMIKMIKDKQNFNLKLVIDDFIKYSELYSNNQIEYLQHLENEQHKKHNLCIGFLRFIFSYEIEVDQKIGRQNIDIRIPLGDFQSSPLQDPKVTIIMDKIFHKEEWFKQEKGKPHSEKVLLSWIIQNCKELAQRISLKLDLVQVKNLVLEKVYLEITSELRVCNSCIDMLLAFPHYYVSDLILEKLKLNQTIQIHEEFHLIVVAQFLNESQSKGALQLRKRVQSFEDFRKKTIYFEVGYVGLITEIYFKNRYLSCKSQVFTQQIDEIQLGNTFFLSDDLDEELQEQQTVQQHDNQSKSSSKSSSRAVIYTPLTTALNNIKQEQSQHKQIIHVYNEKTIYQERILQCYQLIWKFYQNLDQPLIEIDVHFFSRYLYYWFIGDYNNTLNFHYEFLKLISQETQDQSTFLDKTMMKLNYQTIFNNGNANIKLLLFDYIFLNHYTTQKP